MSATGWGRSDVGDGRGRSDVGDGHDHDQTTAAYLKTGLVGVALSLVE